MKRAMCIALGLVLLSGCAIRLSGDGKVGFLYRSDTFVGFVHEADDAGDSEATYEAPSLEDWIVSHSTTQPVEASTNGLDKPDA